MHETPLDELRAKLEPLGLRLVTEYAADENSADVYVGDEKVCGAHYSEAEGGWSIENDLPLYSPLDDTVNGIKFMLKEHTQKKKREARQLTFTVTIEYKANAPTSSPSLDSFLAALVAKSIDKLVPDKPKPRAVVVNGSRVNLKKA